MSSLEELIDKKNTWLSNQVEVEFPTEESIKGRKLYLDKEEIADYQSLSLNGEINDSADTNSSGTYELHKADFHRMTVMFSKHQSEFWQDKAQGALVLEFLAQIILSEEHELYLGFSEQSLLFTAIVTKEEKGGVLISDIVLSQELNSELSNKEIAWFVANELELISRDSKVWYNS